MPARNVAIVRLLHLSARHEGENWTTLIILGALERGAGCAIPGGINAELRGLIARSADPADRAGCGFPCIPQAKPWSRTPAQVTRGLPLGCPQQQARS